MNNTAPTTSSAGRQVIGGYDPASDNKGGSITLLGHSGRIIQDLVEQTDRLWLIADKQRQNYFVRYFSTLDSFFGIIESEFDSRAKDESWLMYFNAPLGAFEYVRQYRSLYMIEVSKQVLSAINTQKPLTNQRVSLANLTATRSSIYGTVVRILLEAGFSSLAEQFGEEFNRLYGGFGESLFETRETVAEIYRLVAEYVHIDPIPALLQ